MQTMVNRQAQVNVAATPVHAPLVLIDGVPHRDVWVKRVVIAGLLDERQVELAVTPINGGFAREQRLMMQRLRHAKVMVAMEVGLEGGEARLWPVLNGWVEQVGQTLDGKHDQWTMTGRCDWSLLLDRRVEDIDDASILLQQLEMNGEAAINAEPISGATFRVALQRLCERTGYCVERWLRWIGQGVQERRRLRQWTAGRPVMISGGVLNDAAGAVQAMQGMAADRGPVKLIAEMGPQEVESTFKLSAGWRAADEGLADEQYVKSTSSDFDAVTNVYRAWVLNEDGAYGPAYDLTTLFGEGRSMAGQPVRFHGCLTQDGAGRPLGVVVESSIDGGANWTRYPGRLSVMADRGGVYLEDDALTHDFFTAAKAGMVRVRVTATVRSAWPTQHVRWIGNPFAGHFEQVRFDVADRFAWRRLDAGSRYADAVMRGKRTADVADDRLAMEQWLATRSRQQMDATVGQVRMQTTQPLVGLRIGDRLVMIDGWRIGVGLDDPAINADAADQPALVRIEHRWDGQVGSVLTWQW